DDSGGNGHVHKRTDPEKFFPTRMRITMVQVAKGATYDPELVPNLPENRDPSGAAERQSHRLPDLTAATQPARWAPYPYSPYRSRSCSASAWSRSAQMVNKRASGRFFASARSAFPRSRLTRSAASWALPLPRRPRRGQCVELSPGQLQMGRQTRA